MSDISVIVITIIMGLIVFGMMMITARQDRIEEDLKEIRMEIAHNSNMHEILKGFVFDNAATNNRMFEKIIAAFNKLNGGSSNE